MTHVLVLGASGMLGHVVCKYLFGKEGYHVTGSVQHISKSHESIMANRILEYSVISNIQAASSADTGVGDINSIYGILRDGKFDYVINCIGKIKPCIDDESMSSRLGAIMVNSVFPNALSAAAAWAGARVIQIATDCVFSGINGAPYSIGLRHDAHDVYGKTKSLGEVSGSMLFRNLRCSIIGPELAPNRRSLWEWVRQTEEPSIKGFKNHTWNGITTLAFARICDGIMSTDGLFDKLDSTEFVCPDDITDKYDLVRLIRSASGRYDVSVDMALSLDTCNRRLVRSAHNGEMWRAAGYAQVPTIAELICEMGQF